MASLASLLGPSIQIPQSDFSWLDSAFDSIGGAMQRGQQNKSFNKLADLIGQPQQGQQMQQQPVMGGMQQEQAYTAPVMPVERGPVQKGSIYQPFMDTVRAGGVTNPFALSAIAATGKAESGWSAANANRTWSDPSESGQAGTAGGALSWRGPRYQAMAAGGDLSPEAQAKFFLQEDPQLIQALQASKSPEEAQRLMNNAWKFAGYDRPGGEAARRMAMAQNYYAQEYGKQGGAAQAIEDIAPAGGFDDGRFADVIMPAQGRDQLATALQQGNLDASTQTENASAAPVQVADASGGIATSTAISGASAQGVTPIQRGGVSPEIIQFMLRDPNLRDMGMKLWQQSVTGKTGEAWQFVKLPDGTLARANQQTGAVETIGNFAKAPKADGGDEWGLTPVWGTNDKGETVLGQVSKSGKFKPLDTGAFNPTPGISNSDLGTSVVTRNNRTGQVIDTREKDLRGAEREKELGTTEGKNQAAAAGDVQAGLNAKALINDLRNDPNRERGTGWSSLGNRVPATAGYDYQNKVDQAKSGAFLTAIQQMRGLGALSNSEGQTATAAVTRMDTATSEEAFLSALADYEKIIDQGIARAQARIAKTPTSGTDDGAADSDPLGIR